MASNLKSWRKYIDSCNQKPHTNVARFNARYKLARNFDGIILANSSLNTQSGYAALMKVGFAYSALESFEKFVNYKVKIKDADLAIEFREPRFDKLITALKIETNKKLNNRLDNFLNSKDLDVRLIAEAIRHLTFHGVATVNGLGLTASVNHVLVDLSDRVLDELDVQFTVYLAGLE